MLVMKSSGCYAILSIFLLSNLAAVVLTTSTDGIVPETKADTAAVSPEVAEVNAAEETIMSQTPAADMTYDRIITCNIQKQMRVVKGTDTPHAPGPMVKYCPCECMSSVACTPTCIHALCVLETMARNS